MILFISCHGDGGKQGGFLIQSIATAFSSDKYFYNQSLSDIVRQTRIMIAKLTQPSLVTVYDRNSLPYKVKFLRNYQSRHDDEKEFESFTNANKIC